MRSVLSSYGKGIHTLRGQLRRIEPVSFKAHAPAASPMCEVSRPITSIGDWNFHVQSTIKST